MAKEQVSQEKGQARIQQLMEMFPGTSRQAVIKADYEVEGLRHTAVLDDIGRWAWPDPYDHYLHDHDADSQKDLVGGLARTPKKMNFGAAKELQIELDSRSPYEVKYEGGGRYWLYRDGDPIEEVYFIPCPQWFWKTTSSGQPLNQVITANFERVFGVFVTTYCEYFKEGNQCIYCNLNPTLDFFAELGEERLMVKREQDVYEAYMVYAQEGGEKGIDEIKLYGGSFYNRSKEADLYIRNLAVMKRAMRDSGYGCEEISITCQVMEEADSLRLKEAGATVGCHHMEVWDPKMFEVVCPGKTKKIGREHWLECLLQGVEVFGWGRVLTTFVVGVELAPPFGFKTEEEAAASAEEGYRWMASHGVWVENNPFRPRQGAVLAQAPSPRAEYILRMEQAVDKLHKEYNLVGPHRYERGCATSETRGDLGKGD